MTTQASRAARVVIVILVAALGLSVGCNHSDTEVVPPDTNVNILLVNSSGAAGLIVNVDGPGSSGVDVALPAAPGSAVTEAYPGGAGDILIFRPRIVGGAGFGSCTATPLIVGGTTYGQVNITYDVSTGFSVTCWSGWAESAPRPEGARP